jgi:hypothetical protein
VEPKSELLTQAREVAAQPGSLSRGWASACAIFAVSVLVALAGSLGIASQLGGNEQYQGAAVAWALCWGAGLISLLMVVVGRSIGQGLGAVLLGMMVRMMLPLAGVMFLVQQSPAWRDTNVVGFLLGNYLLALFVDTAVALLLLQGSAPVTTKTSASASKPAAGELAGSELVP